MASDVITRFKLETAQYESKLRDIAKGLKDFVKETNDGGEGLDKFSKEAIEAARALGTTASGATNARDRVRDLVGAYNEAAVQFNKLSEAQQQGDFGKSLADSLERLKVRISEAKKELYGMGDAMNKTGDGGLFSRMGDKMSGALQVFAGNMLTKAAGAVANLGSEMADMVKQGVELAKQGEGIRIAFERLGRGDILDGLRQATHGTVTDIELMKAAVKFNDFKLPLDELGTMLAFAQQKAKDTGQSVDYMVDSIVTGLGRKSLMILDNLGLSAAEIKEKMAETGDMTKAVGAIIREQMEKAGDYVETAADRAAQANVSLQNKMEELGRKFAPLEEASNNLWTSMKIGIMDVIGGPLTDLLNKLTEAGRLASAYGVLGGNAKVGRMTANLSSAREENRQIIYQQQLEQFWRYINPREQQIKDIRAWQSGERNDALKSRIGAITEKYGSLDVTKIQAEVDAAKKMLADYQSAAKQILQPVKPVIDTIETEQSVTSLTKKLKDLQEQRKKAIAAGDTDLSKNLLKQINQTKADIKGLGGTVGSTTTRTKTEPTYAADSIAAQAKLVQDLTKQWNEAGADVRDKYVAPIIEAERKLKDMKNQLTLAREQSQGRLLGGKQQTQGLGSVVSTTTQSVSDTMSIITKLRKKVQEEINTENLKIDQNIFKEVFRVAVQNGIDGMDIQFSALSEKIAKGIDISDGAWEFLAKQINEKLKDMGLDPIEINFKTGKLSDPNSDSDSGDDGNGNGNRRRKKEKYEPESVSQVVSDLSGKVGGILSGLTQLGVEIPEGLQGIVGGVQGMMSILTGIYSVVSIIEALQTVKSLPFFSHGGVIGRAAAGLLIPGNSNSGDNLRLPMMDGSGFIGVNSGELILNKSQQNNLANALEGGGLQGMNLSAQVSGEQILLVANRTLRRKGKGELVTWK